jgi:hypothetical protein
MIDQSKIGSLMTKNIILYLFSINLITIFSLCISESNCQTMNEGVHLMADAIVKDLHNEGPIAWLKYFSNSNQFFMASNGMLVFPNIDSANSFVPKYAKQIQRVDLLWTDIRVDSLTPDYGIMAATYHETIISATGVQDTPSGYFTGVVEKTVKGWKLRDAHWSTLNSQH